MEEIDILELIDYYKSKLSVFLLVFSLVCLLGCSYSFFLQKAQRPDQTQALLQDKM